MLKENCVREQGVGLSTDSCLDICASEETTIHNKHIFNTLLLFILFFVRAGNCLLKIEIFLPLDIRCARSGEWIASSRVQRRRVVQGRRTVLGLARDMHSAAPPHRLGGPGLKAALGGGMSEILVN